ncbi:hypothetical protein [Streptomyces nitrosporeus]|uniref:hypothetical protein n=1 Tax=Streptomyces nitrosporeus TaxID=28894 RepID=UPI0039A1BCF1
MAQDSWPSPEHNSRAVTDSEYEILSARYSDDGVYGSPSDPPAVTAGIGLAVTVTANVTASVRGHAWTSGPTGNTLTIAPNPTSSTRIDRVVLRLDRSTWTVRAAIRQGTPGSAAPPLTQAPGTTGLWEILLAGVTVPSGATSVTVTRGELYVGSRIRPALSSHLNPYPRVGEMAWETDTQQIRLWDGASWRTPIYSTGTINVSQPLLGWSIQTDSVLEVRNGVANLRLGSFVRTARDLPGETNSRLPVLIPPQYRHPVRDQYVICYITGGHVGRCTIRAQSSPEPGQVWLTQKPDIAVGRTVLTSGASWVVD